MITKKSSVTRFTLEVTGFRLAPTRPRRPTIVPETWAESPDLPSPAGKGCLPAFPRSAARRGEGRGEKKRGGEREGSPRGQYPPCQESRPGSPAAPRAVPRGGSWRRGGPSPNLEMPTPLSGRPGLKGNGSPFVSLTCTHQTVHPPEKSRGTRGGRLKVAPDADRPSHRPGAATGAPAVSFPPPPPRRPASRPANPSFFPLRHFRIYP